jgi:hypothetical protein
MMNGSLQAEMQCDEAEGGERGEWQRKQAALAVCDGPTAPPPLSLSGIKIMHSVALRCAASIALRLLAILRCVAIVGDACDALRLLA